MAASTRHLARLAAIVLALTIVCSPAAHAYYPWTNPFTPYYSATLNLINTSSLYGSLTVTTGYSGGTNINAGSLMLSGSSTFNYGSVTTATNSITISGATLNPAPLTGGLTVLGSPTISLSAFHLDPPSLTGITIGPDGYLTIGGTLGNVSSAGGSDTVVSSGTLVVHSPSALSESLNTVPIPEPATLTLAVAAVGLVLATRRMRR
jgi:hypothetical protein